jgi:hypothetical protein
MTALQNQPKQENAFLNILLNVVLPVLILNKLSDDLGPAKTLLLALAFPMGYGIYDLIQRKKVNAISILGILNVGLTGGLALSGLDGIWFAVKEAAFPLLIGAFVAGSAFTAKPFVKTLLMNPQVMKLEVIEEKLKINNSQTLFEGHLKTSTLLLSASFLLSAGLNFWLAVGIFIPLDPSLDETARNLVLNKQIADMTSKSFLVIMLPSIIFLSAILWHLVQGIRKHTGLKMEEIMRTN